MLRVGLTGNLGSGKSTVAALFAAKGAHVLSSDGIGREMMQPGHEVFDRIVDRFGPTVLRPDGTLDRAELARLAFDAGRVDELNAIVHPAVIAKQAELIQALWGSAPDAVAIVESALIFEIRETRGEDPRPGRFDRILLVTAPESSKIERFVARAGGGSVVNGAEEARRRLALQIPDDRTEPLADDVICNDGTLADLEVKVDRLWFIFVQAACGAESLQ